MASKHCRRLQPYRQGDDAPTAVRVRLDYSDTYRSNDQLDTDLDEQLEAIARSEKRALSEHDELLETARAQAENTLRLKEAALKQKQHQLDRSASVSFLDDVNGGVDDVNGGVDDVNSGVDDVNGGVDNVNSGADDVNGCVDHVIGGVDDVHGGVDGGLGDVDGGDGGRDNTNDASEPAYLTFPSQPGSAPRRGRSSPAAAKASSAADGRCDGSKRRVSNSLGSLFSRRASVLNGRVGAARPDESGTTFSADLADAARAMTLTDRRLAMDRERFSAKNLFNVVRTNSTLHYAADSADHGPAEDKGPTRSRGARPATAPAGTRAPRRRHALGLLRATTSSASRLSRFSDPSFSPDFGGVFDLDVDQAGIPHRRFPRSRKELEKLARLNIDPFVPREYQAERVRVREEETLATLGKDPVQQQLLHKLSDGRPELQGRVTAFLRGVEEFNKRCRKSGLDQILDAK